MPDASSGNHAAAAWVAGQMNPVQRQEFEAHLAKCPSCQEEVTGLLAQALQPPPPPTAPIKVEVQQPVAGGGRQRAVRIAIAAILTLVAGFALGWSIWQMAHH